MKTMKIIIFAVVINILLFSFLPLLHHFFHSPVSALKPVEVDVVRIAKEHSPERPPIPRPSAQSKTQTRVRMIHPEISRKITFELDPSALSDGVDLLAPCVTYDISEVEQLPRLVTYREPDYPLYAASKGIEGVVVLKILIDADGKVAMVNILDNSGLYDFGVSAARAVKTWVYEPAKIMNTPVAVWGVQEVRFEIKGSR